MEDFRESDTVANPSSGGEGGSTEGNKISRRRFLGRAAKIIAATVGSSILLDREVSHERDLAEDGVFETDLAFWYPFYEKHSWHEDVLPAMIDPEIEVLSLEGGFPTTNPNDSLFNREVEDFLTTVCLGLDSNPPSENRYLPDEAIYYLRKNGIRVALGDIAYEILETHGMSTSEKVDIKKGLLETREIIGIVLLGGAPVVMGASTMLEDGDSSGAVEGGKLSRRKFLERLGIGMTGTGAILAGSRGAEKLAFHRLVSTMGDKPNEGGKQTVKERVWARIDTVAGYLVPEKLNDLFRELIQANKLMSLAGYIGKEKGTKPRVGYNWHLGHRGIEDWLRVDRQIVRSCILAYPDKLLRRVIKANGNDPRCLYAIRVFDIPSDYGEVDYNNPRADRDIVIEDKVLKEKLDKRGLLTT